MESLQLEVEKREVGGKGPARRIRAQGKLPGVFYGPGAPATPIAMDAVTFDRRIRNLEGMHLIELKSSEGTLAGRKVLVRDLQEHPVTGVAVHVDLVEVPLDKPIEVLVPLHFVGKAEGVTLGGVLQPILRELEMSCLPTHIPQSIDVDVTSLGVGQSLHVGELSLPEGAQVVRTDNAPVVSVQAPKVSAKPGEATDGEGQAPAAGSAGGAESSEGGEKS